MCLVRVIKTRYGFLKSFLVVKSSKKEKIKYFFYSPQIFLVETRNAHFFNVV